MIIDGVDVHCQYCMCPVEVWKPFFKTYSGDGCKLYDDFTNVISEFEYAGKPFNNQDILNKCRADFEMEYTDISDFETTIYEMIDIHYSERYMPSNYRPFTVIK